MGDFFVHHRLCNKRIIGFVMTMFAEADNIDHHIFMKGVAVLKCRLRDQTYCFGVITINVEDWCLNHLGNIRAINRRTIVPDLRS